MTNRPAAHGAYEEMDDLIGRQAEIARLRGLVESAPEGGDAIVMLGDAGIGKSTLLAACVAHATNAGFLVLPTTGVEAEASLPYSGLDQLLRPALFGAEALPTVQRDALLTALGRTEGAAPEPFLVGLACLNLLAEVAVERPVLVAVDDVHWLDRPTHDAIAFLARRVARDPIAVVGAMRYGYPGPFREAGLSELEVHALSQDPARAVLDRTAPDLPHGEREQVLREALGNPLALVELPIARRANANAAPDRMLPLTARLERAFAGRIAELSPEARDAVLIAATDHGDELPEILAATSALAGHDVKVDVLDAAVAAGLVRFDEMRVHFRHPLVRSGVLQSESIARRQAAHRALAGVLDADPYRQTWHQSHAVVGPDDAVADKLEACHLVALQRGSPLSAIWALERSAQLTTSPANRARRLLIAAEHAFGLGRADMVERMIDGASRTQLSELDRARVEWLREIFNDGVPGDSTRVYELCAIARQSIAEGDAGLAMNLLLGAALRGWWADVGEPARDRVVAVINEMPGHRDDPRLVAALAMADPERSAAEIVEHLSTIVLENVDDADTLRLLGMAGHAVNDPVHAVDFCRRAEAKLREQGRLGLLVHVLTMQILDWIDLGDWEAAATAGEEARRLAAETGQPIWDTGSLSLAAVLAGVRGDNETAQALAGEAETAAANRRLNDLLACVQFARGLGWISTGHYEEAYDALRRIFDPRDAAHHRSEQNHAVMFLAEAAARTDHLDEARAIVMRLEEQGSGAPTRVVQLSYARAVLADDDEAETHYLAALSQDLTRWPWVRARLELAYGSWLRRQRRVAESRSPLRAARATLAAIGANHWAEIARTELRAAGERDTEPANKNATSALSAQELQIARLAAAGLSNREIGERLYLSHRTVGSHLYRIFPKLNITSRAQLAARMETL